MITSLFSRMAEFWLYPVGRLMLDADISEPPQAIFQRVFQELKPRTKLADMQVKFCPFANANSFIRLEGDGIRVRITDVLDRAPAPILEALAFILLSKLYRRPVPKAYSDRYRRYLNRKEMRRMLDCLRQARGRKLVTAPEGRIYNLEQIFDQLNFAHFFGLMARPALGWSLRTSRVTLGHYDPSHNAIVLNKILDSDKVPRLAVEYVMFHEMLHLRYPVEHRATRRCVHTREFKEAERQFPGYSEAKNLLKGL